MRGDAHRPRGHALVVFRRSAGSDEAFATYAVVLPIIVEPMKYLPPALASQFQGMAGALQGLDAVPMPPIPEAMTVREAVRLADRRDDDLVDAGTTDGSPLALMHQAQEAVRDYADAFRRSLAPMDGADGPHLDTDDDTFRWLLMDERARIDEMTRLVGRLRDDVEREGGTSDGAVRDALLRLGATLPAKYRSDELVAGAARTGAIGTRLAQLYLDRCYRLCAEQYEDLAEIDREIARLEASDDAARRERSQ